MPRSKSSDRWLKEHFNDPYVKLAKDKGYRSRATFKLLEIQEKDKLVKPGMTVIDLGSAPGGWSQVAANWVGRKGQVFALDILPMDGLPGVEFIQGDFRDEAVLSNLLNLIGNQKADLVISDMAPNTSGVKSVDQPRAVYLAELALELAQQVLHPGGALLVKVFQGEGFDNYFRALRESFKTVSTRKPKASRPRSKEVYLLAKDYKL